MKGINTIIVSGDREEAVANIANRVGIESKSINASLAPQQKTSVISNLQAAGHCVAMVILIYHRYISVLTLLLPAKHLVSTSDLLMVANI